MLNSSEIKDIIEETFADVECKALKSDICDIENQIDRLKIELKALKLQCPHPRKHIVVKSHGYNMGDGYGGDDWIDEGYQAQCVLCDKTKLSTTFYNEGRTYSGERYRLESTNPKIEEALKAKITENEKVAEKRAEDRLRDKELLELQRLKAKYTKDPKVTKLFKDD